MTKRRINKKSIAFLTVSALVLGGLSAQASGILNTPAGGYLVCVDTKTGAVTHPGTLKCKKGQKRLVLGAQGSAGLVGASGLPGKSGNTLWTGNGEPSSTLGIPGDSYLDLAGKKIYSPKATDGMWPAGISVVGPQGPQGPQGPGGSGPAGPAGPAGSAGISAPIATQCIGSKCTYKVGDTGPGGGVIFFVDYHDIYEGFDYLEIANQGWAQEWYESFDWNAIFEEESETAKVAIFPNGYANDPLMEWCYYSDDNYAVGEDFFSEDADIQNLSWLLSAVGRGGLNSGIALEGGCVFGAVKIADEYATSKSDWFLPSIGELMLAYTNMRQLGFSSFVSGERFVDAICFVERCINEFTDQIEAAYWSSTLRDPYTAFHQHFDTGAQTGGVIDPIGYNDFDGENPFSPVQFVSYVRPIRSF